MGTDVEEKNLGANGPDWPGGPGLLDWPGLTVSVLNNGRAFSFCRSLQRHVLTTLI